MNKITRNDKKHYRSFTDILYSEPGYIRGVMRILDIGRTVNDFNYSNTPEEADYKALNADWVTIGNDIRNVLLDGRN